MLNIALFGPPGAGKGTQSQFLVDAYNLGYISTGDLLRKELQEETDLGKQAKDIIASGGLVSDEIIVQILERTISENPQANGFLFDGFPRTVLQAYILEGLLTKLGTSLDCLINLQISDEIAVERLVERGKTSGRSDDNEEVIRNRLKEYHDKTHQVLDFYADKGTRVDVDGTASVEEVRNAVSEIAKAQYAKRPVSLVMFGYPGSGRGSQAKALAKTFGLEFISPGKMLDEEIAAGSELGNQVQASYEHGELVPDEIIIPLIEKRLAKAKDTRGFIFKGFPRTLVQSYILDGLLRKYGCASPKILEIEVPVLELMERLVNRSQTDARMPYDTDTARIVQRLREHEKNSVPVIRKYGENHGVSKVDGTGTFEEVQQACDKEVAKLFQVGQH